MSALPAPGLSHVCDITVDLSTPMEMGAGRAGRRRIIPITGGTVAGPRVRGRLLHLGADWQTIFANGLAELDARYAIETHDGALIEVVNYGFRHGPEEVIAAIARGEEVDPARYYMRTQARLESADPAYEWVNRSLFVGTGARLAAEVRLSLFELT